MAVFPGDGVLVEEGAVWVANRSEIRDKDVEAFGFG